MSFNEDEKINLINHTTENMEQENEVTMEEASANLDCVKKELEEFEFVESKYGAFTHENIFGESSKEQRNDIDSSIDFLDNDIMETESIKVENKIVIRRNIEQSHCNRCGGNYDGYCLNCSSLSHILNNLAPNINPEPDLNTTPINILEIREVSGKQSVFALKTLPKGIILGPFEGIVPIESTNGLQWKIRNKRILNDQNGNWMKYIESVTNYASKNLDVFQFDGILYFGTSREIHEGEELFVCYREEKEEVLKSNKEEEFYLIPVKKEEYPKVFACTLCCLGFRLESCLMEHKSKCPQRNQGANLEDFEIIQCDCCKVWLEKLEFLESHKLHCLESYNRLSHNLPGFQPTNIGEEDSKGGGIVRKAKKKDRFHGDLIRPTHSNISEKEYKCSECFYQTNCKRYLKQHLSTHKDIKEFECDICKHKFGHKGHLNVHIRIQHSNTSEKEYKCSECPYQTGYKSTFKQHLNTHKDIKEFECEICKKRFTLRCSLQMHIRDHHSSTSEKEYKCSECPYQTNYKSHLNSHVNTHSDIKAFECDICKKRFTQKSSLNHHIRTQHSNTIEKEYKCTDCPYQTNDKNLLKNHLNTHTDIKAFECHICKKSFIQKNSLKQHIKNQHSTTTEKEYKCPECSYQTNRKEYLKLHLNTHQDIKPFECDTCKKRYTQRDNLKVHVRNHHSNTNEKEYKCPECSYQTNYKCHLKSHLNTHTDIKAFECDICKKRFSQKSSLNLHIRSQHSNTSEKEYKCTDCSYQTNRKEYLKLHLNTHKGIKPFECDICKKSFTQKGYLKFHTINQHSNISE